MKVYTTLLTVWQPYESNNRHNGPPFSSEPFAQFMSNQWEEHITSSPHYPKSNGFIKRQVKIMKTSLATATTSGKTLDEVLLSLRSTPIGPNLPSPREILHNHAEEHPGQPSHPVDYEQVRNYLLDKKATQKEYHDKSHNAKPLSELEPGQKVLFLSPREENQYIKGTITTKAATPRSYYIESQGKTYCHIWQHICTINTEIPVSQDHQQEIVQVSQDHQQVNTTVIILFHKTIMTGTEFLFCKTINKDTDINNQKSSLQNHHNHQIPWMNCYST